MKEQRKRAKDGPDADPMKEMRERYERAVEADQENRDLALADLKFVTIPGHQWEESQRKARKGRPCYEFPILRSHWRQVVNDQKKARPGIKVRAAKDATAKDAELRQGLIRNIESCSNAEWAYDGAFELLVAGGFGAWRITTEYSDDDGWEQDIRVRPIPDPLSTVWFDPDAKALDCRDAMFAFVEETLSREAFEAKYPDAQAISFDAAKAQGCGDWYGPDSVRVAEYWRRVPVQKVKLLLSDGRTVDEEEVRDALDELAAQGITVTRKRVCNTHKVIMSIVSGLAEIDGPHDSIFDRIPIVPVYANRHFIDGKWVWCGLVRHAKDSQKLTNYNITSGQEALSKQHKSVPLVTPKMLEGAGVKQLWDRSNAMDVPYLPYTPDALVPGGPHYLSSPPIHAAFVQMGQLSIDLVKMATGIFDESQGKASNATSGRAILARQNEGDTATFDYQDALNKGIQATGEIIDPALQKVYDTQRQVRVMGKDGAENFVTLYEEVRDQQTGQMVKVNDLSKGKFDVSVATGPSYDTQRMEFVDTLSQMSSGNQLIAQGVPDLIVGAMDFPKAEEAAERLKLLLPPPIQQAMAQKDQSPAVMQLQGQLQQIQQMAEQHIAELQQEMQQLQAKAQSKDDAIAREYNASKQFEIDKYKAITERMALGIQVQEAEAEFAYDYANSEADRQHAAYTQAADQQHQAAMAQQTAALSPPPAGNPSAQ